VEHDDRPDEAPWEDPVAAVFSGEIDPALIEGGPAAADRPFLAAVADARVLGARTGNPSEPVAADAVIDNRAEPMRSPDPPGAAHPAILERGLNAALSGIAASSPFSFRLHVELPHRPPRATENLAYSVLSEALRNVAQRPNASRVEVRVAHYVDAAGGEILRLGVADNGDDGADQWGGDGLRAVEQRVRSADGTIDIDSRPGGPTVLVVDLPCRW
jgi:hypothetical protein